MSESNSPKDDPSQSSTESEVNIEPPKEVSAVDGEESMGLVDEEATSSQEGAEPEGSGMGEKLELLAAEVAGASSTITSSPAKQSKLLLISIIAFLILVSIGLSTLGFYGWSMFQKLAAIEQSDVDVARLTEKVAHNESSIVAAKKELIELNAVSQQKLKASLEGRVQAGAASMNTTLSSVRTDFRSLSAKNLQQVDMLQKRVDGHQQRLLSLSTTSREDWMLAEAEYLLRLANQRILLERTSENVVALMASADQLVEQVAGGMGDPELFAIRQAISRDLTVLKLIDPVDKDGIYLKLQSLGELIERLPRVPGPELLQVFDKPTDTGEPQNSTAGEEGEERSFLAALWHELSISAGVLDQYIKYEDSTAPVKPLVDQHFTQIAGLNVRLLLEQAQIALIKESPTIYSNSLSKASELVSQYYIVSPPALEFQKSLQALESQNIAPELPDISQPLKLLHGYIRQLHKIESVDEGQL